MKKIGILFLCYSLVAGLEVNAPEAYESLLGNCSSNSDCSIQYVCTEGTCAHKELFPLSSLDILFTVIATFVNGLGTAGGVGEGALIIPYLILIGKYTITKATSLAYAIVFGGVVGNLLNIIWVSNEKDQKPLINYDINLLVIPGLLIGVPFGVVLHTVLSPSIIYGLILKTLVFFIFKIGVRLYKARKESQPQSPVLQMGSPEEIEALAPANPQNEISVIKESYAEEDTLEKEEKVKRTLKQGQQDDKSRDLFPAEKYQEIFFIVLALVATTFLKGSKNFESIVGIGFCSVGYWSMDVVNVVIMSLLFLRNSSLVKKWQNQRESQGYSLSADEIKFDNKKLLLIFALSVFAGLMGGTLSIGGALILAPFLLNWGMSPKAVVATTGFFIVFTMFSSTVETMMYGQIGSSEFVWFALINFVFSFATSRILHQYVQKSKKENIILLVLVIEGLISLCMMVYLTFDLFSTSYTYMKTFSSFCV